MDNGDTEAGRPPLMNPEIMKRQHESLQELRRNRNHLAGALEANLELSLQSYLETLDAREQHHSALDVQHG